MKRLVLIKHLRKHRCLLLREGANHSWWINPDKNLRSAVPRHSEIKDLLAKKICNDLGIPAI
jgi:mRNA interferase HicA